MLRQAAEGKTFLRLSRAQQTAFHRATLAYHGHWQTVSPCAKWRSHHSLCTLPNMTAEWLSSHSSKIRRKGRRLTYKRFRCTANNVSRTSEKAGNTTLHQFISRIYMTTSSPTRAVLLLLAVEGEDFHTRKLAIIWRGNLGNHYIHVQANQCSQSALKLESRERLAREPQKQKKSTARAREFHTEAYNTIEPHQHDLNLVGSRESVLCLRDRLSRYRHEQIDTQHIYFGSCRGRRSDYASTKTLDQQVFAQIS